jgi:hypothetical protein
MAADDSLYKPGDPPPGGYLNWHAWAEVQDKAGLRQKKCRQCGLWKFPQELSGLTCLGCSTPGVMACDPAALRGVREAGGGSANQQGERLAACAPTEPKGGA